MGSGDPRWMPNRGVERLLALIAFTVAYGVVWCLVLLVHLVYALVDVQLTIGTGWTEKDETRPRIPRPFWPTRWI